MKSKNHVKGKDESDKELAQFSRFYVLRIRLPSVDIIRCSKTPVLKGDDHESLRVVHELYLKVHEDHETKIGKSRKRAIFLVNVPRIFKTKTISELFTLVGSVIDVKWANELKSDEDSRPLNSGGTSAHVFFKTEKEAKRATMCSSYKFVNGCVELDSLESLASQYWLSNFNKSFPDICKLKEDVTAQIELFDLKESEERKNFAKITETPDGFKLISSRRNIVLKTITEEDKKKMKRKELPDFYKFQIRETKREKFADIKDKFQEDKKHIAELRASGHFNPY